MMNIKKKRILVVDDDETMREIYKDMFSDAADKYEIDDEGDAKVALKKTQDGKYDLVVLDMLMEPMDGETFYYHMRENEKTKHTPVIIVSVLRAQEIENIKIKGVYFLEKPITQEQLFEKVGSALGHSS